MGDSAMLKQLLNLPESVTDQRLREICDDFDATVYPKVRVADVLPIEKSGIDNEQYRYALQAHFDFVVADSKAHPLFVVEFDGSSHSEPDAKRRDRLKNALWERFNVPILRINRRYLSDKFSDWDLLRWFATVFFVKRSWDEDVESGRIPPEDSVFDPAFVSVRTKSGYLGLDLERGAWAEFGRLSQAQKIPWHIPNWITARDTEGVLRAIAWMPVSNDEAVVAETAMHPHNLGDWVQFAVRGIVLTHLMKNLTQVLEGKDVARPREEIVGRAREFESAHTVIMAFGLVEPK
ncbi:hypothetical protein DEH80_06555 [Abyssibacter profundi]|uniref:DUF2726 domain-containing protein n=2 Tax=Abyssibacter profundi TaxID=2182787 RepID=A0A363UM27_9GAMM|nr:hypothetical protein DEH80_06555 [Abyssibacter profundi]